MFQPKVVRRSGQGSISRWLPAVAACCTGLLMTTSASAVITFSTSISDPSAQVTPYHSRMLSAVGASLGSWGSYLSGSADLSIEVEITDSIPRATGASVTSGFIGNNGRYDVFEQGAAFEIRTGIDPNGPAPDIRIQINGNYLANELWFDPDPSARQAEVAVDRIDAVSVLLHEFGHAFAFNGWGDLTTGALPSDFASPWDVLTTFDGNSLSFNGASAIQAYGGPVPISQGNNFHIGNPTGSGLDLVSDLMNGVALFPGRRYSISGLDLAMMQDMGVPVVVPGVPEPGTYALILAGLACMGAGATRRSLSRRGVARVIDLYDAFSPRPCVSPASPLILAPVGGSPCSIRRFSRLRSAWSSSTW